MSKQFRWFSLVTYNSIERDVEIIQSKGVQVRSYALIRHDKDGGEPHNHVLIRTVNSKTLKNIKSWHTIDGQNVLIESIKDKESMYDYLTHKNDKDKHQYEDSEIIDGGLLEDIQKNNLDSTYDILEMLIEGKSLKEIARIYGRDFVYNYHNYRELYRDIVGYYNDIDKK